MTPASVRYDLHLHTFRSYDCLSSYKAIIAAVQARGLTGIAVTDHNTMRGAKELARIAPFPVILAEEIKTREGEIIGYFMQEQLPRGLGLEETIRLVHEQGGGRGSAAPGGCPAAFVGAGRNGFTPRDSAGRFD